MKKISYILIVLLLIGLVYLWYLHASIYWELGRVGLSAPADFKESTVGEGTTSPLMYVALGDSLTAGVGVDTYVQSYPYLVAQDLAHDRHTQVTLQPFAIPGIRSFYVLSNFIEPTIAAKPDVITLLIGINDIHGNIPPKAFRENYDAILQALTKRTSAQIYAITLPYIGTNNLIREPFATYFNWRIKQYNQIIIELAEKYQVTSIDLYSAQALISRDSAYYASDSFHPNVMGYTLWAKTIYASINH